MKNFLVSIYCPHCRRYTALTPATTKVEYGYGQLNVPCIWEREYNGVWWIGICNYCKLPVLVHNKGDRIYPHPLPSPTDERVPENIRKDIDEAKICLSVGAYRACAVMARRALQTACIEKGASKGRLVDQLEELADKGIITKDLKEWADIVRWVGNDAAHPGSEEVKKEDAEDILKLAEWFVDVVYVAPAIAKHRKTKRRK